MTDLLIITSSLVAVMMFAMWIASLVLRDASIVDIFWGIGFAIIAAVCHIVTDGYQPRKILITALALIWGFRLGAHIFFRNRGKGEDYRYQAMRKRHGADFPFVSLLTVFGFQGLLMWIVSMPLQLAQIPKEPDRLIWLDFAGAAIWLIGFLFEAIGDLQLKRFKSDPANKGKVMDRGLWAYTRHPNYFGDALLWWGFYLIAAATSEGRWTCFSPLLMTILLMKVSGVSLLEKRLSKTKPEYRDYINRTNAFFPRFPKKQSAG